MNRHTDPALLEHARQIRDAQPPLDAAGRERMVARIEQEAAADGSTPRGHLAGLVESADVRSPKDGAAFWSGRCPDDPTLSNQHVAQAWAQRHNAEHPETPVTTLEQTPGGARLDSYRLYELGEDDLERLDVDPNEHWERLSQRYAEQARGQTHVFSTDAYPQSVLGRTELPTLRSNPQVGADNVTFAYDPPERLRDGTEVPDNVRQVLGEPGNQARLQIHDPDTPGYLDLDRAGRMPDDELRGHVADLRDRVDRADPQSDPRSDPQPDPRSDPEPGPQPVPDSTQPGDYERQAAHDDERVAASMNHTERDGGYDDTSDRSPGYTASRDFGRGD